MYRFYIILFLIRLLFFQIAFANLTDIADSTILNKKGKTQVDPCILNNMAQQNLFINSEKAFLYAKTALKASLIISNQKEEARAWYNIGNVYNITGENSKALKAYFKALEIRQNINDKEGLSKVLNNIGVLKVNMGEYQKAIDYYNKSLNIKYQLSDTNGIAGTLANIGNIYFLWSKYREAQEYNLKALYLYEQTNNKQGIATCMNHLGAIYENWCDYKSALNSYNIALDLEKHNKNYDGISNTLNNLGNLLNKMGRYDEALNKYEQALEIRRKEENWKGIASTLNNIGTIYTNKGNYEKARQYYSEALNISRQINSEYETTVNLYAIGNNYLITKNYLSAKTYFEESLELAAKNNLRELISDNYKALAEVYSKINLYNKAFKSLEKYMMLKDSIFSKETHKQMTEIKTRYETEKKQKEIELLKRNILIQKLESDKIEQKLKLRLTLWLSLTGFILLLILSGLIMLRLNHRRKLIIAEQKALRAQMNPHFIFNAMNSIQGFIMENNNEAARKYLNRFSQLMRNILENSKKPVISLKEELNTLNLYLELEKLRFGNIFEFDINVDKNIDYEDINIPPMLIQPLLENAIQHGLLPAGKGGLLQLSFDLVNDKYLKVTVKDNGIGRRKSFEISKKRLNHISTGMKNIQERISLLSKINKGNIQMRVIDLVDKYDNGTGTEVELMLPANI